MGNFESLLEPVTKATLPSKLQLGTLEDPAAVWPALPLIPFETVIAEVFFLESLRLNLLRCKKDFLRIANRRLIERRYEESI